jgi:hypothetical protein
MTIRYIGAAVERLCAPRASYVEFALLGTIVFWLGCQLALGI